MQTKYPTTDYRSQGIDRRRRKIPKLKYILSGGRRTKIRRNDDAQKLILLDTYAWKYLVQISLLLFLSLVDGFFTLSLIRKGVGEAIPYWDLLIEHNQFAYLIVKYSLTAAGCIGILLAGEVCLKPFKIRVKQIYPILITIFLFVTTIQFILYLRLVKF